MKKIIKQAMLQYGGYTGARKISARIQWYNLTRRYLEFINIGHAPLPDKVIFEPTQRCNLKCKMCFQDRTVLAKTRELTSEQITGFFDRSPFFKKVTFIGGEVFVRSDILDLIGHLNRTRDIVISTNGTLIGEAEVNALRQYDRLYTVCVSLDGPRDIHESIRRVKGSYDKTAAAIKALACILPVTVNMVIQDENLQYIPDMIDLCASLHVKKVKIEMERIFSGERFARAMAVNGLASSDLPFAPGERSRGYSLETLRDILCEGLRRGRRSGVDVFIDPPYLMDNLRTCYDNNLLNAESFICHIIDTATIAPNGDVINCTHIRKPFGNIMDAPFEEIWNSEGANAFRRELLRNNLTPLCENCPFMSPAPRKIARKIQSLEGVT